jgi:Flp pilus assembly protein TadD
MPGNSILHNTLGVALMQSGKPLEAEKEFSRAIDLQPDYSKPRFNLGKTLLAEGHNQEAVSNFIAALKLEPVWPEALQNLAHAYAATGDQSNAVNTASLALKIAQTGHDQALTAQIAGELKTYQTVSNSQSSTVPSPH